MTSIQMYQDKRLGTRYAVEVAADGTPRQAMQVNGPRDEEYALTHPRFDEDDCLQNILAEPARYNAYKTLRESTDAWTCEATMSRRIAWNTAITAPKYKNPATGKVQVARIVTDLGYTLDDLKAAIARHGL